MVRDLDLDPSAAWALADLLADTEAGELVEGSRLDVTVPRRWPRTGPPRG